MRPNRVALRIGRFLVDHPGSTGLEIAKGCGLARANIYVRLYRLQERGFLQAYFAERVEGYRRVRYYVKGTPLAVIPYMWEPV